MTCCSPCGRVPHQATPARHRPAHRRLRFVGYRLGDFVYAPCYGQWSDGLDMALDAARIALIDGTFLTSTEMPGVRGHLSIMDSLPHLARHPGVRFRYTHLNNTNPLLSHSPSGQEFSLAAEMEIL